MMAIWLSVNIGDVWGDRYLDAVTSKLFASLGNFPGMVLLDLGPPGLLLGFQLKPADMLTGLTNAFACSHQGAIRLSFGGLGTHHPLAGGDDAGVHLGGGAVSVAEGPMQEAATLANGASVISNLGGVTRGCGPGVVGSVGGRGGRISVAETA